MIIQKAFKIRIYPNKKQKTFFNKTFGCCRIIYNHYLYIKNAFYEENIKPKRTELGYFELKTELESIEKQYKKTNKKLKKTKNENKIKFLKETINALKTKKKEINLKLAEIKENTKSIYKNYHEPTIAEFKHSIKGEDGAEFMFEADSQGMCAAQQDLQTAFKNFYEGRTSFPIYKNKKEKCSYRNCMCYSDINKLIKNDEIIIPSAGKVKFRQDYDFSKLNIQNVRNITVERSKTNKYFCSICCDVEVTEYEHTGNCIGIDLGIKDLVICSDGTKFSNPKYQYKAEKRLKKLQKQHSKKQKGSKNQEKARLKLAIGYEKLANKRKDYLHKITTELIKNNDVICIEDLNVKGMTKNHCMAKAIQDCSFGTIVSMLKYKAMWHNRQIIEVGRFYPSSKLCSCCGHRMNYMGLEIRDWTCPNCGKHHDRDINAGKNILAEGLRILDNNYILGMEHTDVKLVENLTMDDKSSTSCSLKSSGSLKQETDPSLVGQ